MEDQNTDNRIIVSNCINLIGQPLLFTVHNANQCKIGPVRYSITSDKSIVFDGHDMCNLNDWVEEHQIPKHEKGDSFTGYIKTCCIMEHSNGGRGNHKTYNTIQNYFKDNDVKLRVMDITYGGWMAKFNTSGDPDSVDLVIGVQFDNSLVEFSNEIYGAKPPVSWYTEKFGGLSQFRFEKGFFKTSNEAIDFYEKQGEVDDLFGQRYFPVVAIPMSVDEQQVSEVVDYAKGHSNYLVLNDHRVYGLRCKPDELQICIERCYALGGKVPIDCPYDWI